MKVLQILLDNRVGGIATRLLSVAGPLRERGVELSLAVPDEAGGLDGLCVAQGIPTHRLCLGRPSPRSVIRNLTWAVTFGRSVRGLRRLIAEQRYAVVQVNGFACFQGAVAAWREGVPVVWLMANTMYPRWLVRPLMPWIRRHSHVVSISALVHRYFCGSATVGPRESIIHEPVDLAAADAVLNDPSVRDGVRHEFGLAANVPLLACVANLTPAKGHADLLEAFAAVRQRCPAARLLLIGAEFPTQRDHVAALRARASALGLDGTVIWTGQRHDVLRLVSAADVFTMSSHNEGTPIAILEAMALRKPVVATAVGGIPDQVEDQESGFLLPPRNPGALAQRLLELIHDESVRRNMGAKARLQVEKHFSLELHASAFAALYRRLASGPVLRRT